MWSNLYICIIKDTYWTENISFQNQIWSICLAENVFSAKLTRRVLIEKNGGVIYFTHHMVFALISTVFVCCGCNFTCSITMHILSTNLQKCLEKIHFTQDIKEGKDEKPHFVINTLRKYVFYCNVLSTVLSGKCTENTVTDEWNTA